MARRLIVPMVAMVVVPLFLIVHGTSAAPAQVDAEPVEITRSCIIRFYSTGPEVYENSAHGCTAGVTKTYKTDAGTLAIERVTQPGEKITHVGVAVDETLARQLLICGGSGGLGLTLISCYRADTGARTLPKPGPTANAWITWHIILPAPAAVKP